MLKTVKDACSLHDMVFSYEMSDQIENLSDLIEYETDGRDFFEKNYVTSGMEQLLREGFSRLGGQSSQAVFELTQAMGGGKTHLMIAMGLLAKNPQTRADFMPKLMSYGKDAANVVAFSGRQNPDHFIWGEIISQLGKAEEFSKFCSSQNPKPPDTKDWQNILGDGPVLILLDELPPYFEYASTVTVGSGNLATVTTYALSNLFDAALKLPRACIVVSNLSGSYTHASRQISQAMKNMQDESRRQAKQITPVQLSGNEVYEILKKRLFTKLPSDDEIDEVAEAYADKIKQAQDAGYFSASNLDQFIEEVRVTYPFHPSIKHLIALFKDNEDFRQTRGLMQFISRLLQCAWEREQNDVYLVNLSHLDLNVSYVRDEILRVKNELNSAITKDIADNKNAHAEQIDTEYNSDAGSQVANILLSASLSKAVNAVSGLIKEEALEYLVCPNRKPDEFASAFDALTKKAWYLHRLEDGKYCFRDTENLLKRIESNANLAPQPKIDKELKNQLEILFKPEKKNVYQKCQALPEINDIDIKSQRTLIVVNPDSNVPPREIKDYYESITEKNNFLLISGNDSLMADKVENNMRQLWAINKIENESTNTGNAAFQNEVQEKKNDIKSQLHQAIAGTYNCLFYPTKKELKTYKTTFRIGEDAQSVEQQIEEILSKMETGKKYAHDLEENPEKYMTMAEQRLWPTDNRKARWQDIKLKARTSPGWPWLPKAGGMDRLRDIALEQHRWRKSAEEGYIEKGPFPTEKTSVDIQEAHRNDETGEANLHIIPKNAGQNPTVHYSKDTPVTQEDPVVESFDNFTTLKPHLYFLAIDPTGEHETGEPFLWKNTLTIRHQPRDEKDGREVELKVVPEPEETLYTIDGSNPKHGTPYTAPFAIPEYEEVMLQVYAKAGLTDKKATFKIQPKDKEDDGPEIDPEKPAVLKGGRGRIDSTERVFEVINTFKNEDIIFHGVIITIGGGEEGVTVRSGTGRDIGVSTLENIVKNVRKSIGEDQASVAVTFKGDTNFPTGDSLERFSDLLGIDLNHDAYEQG